MNYLWTVLLALVGSAIAVKLRIPAGALVGSLLAVGCANALNVFSVPTPPQGTKFILQVGLGILLGATITSDALAGLRDLWRPALLCTSITLVAGIASGLAISRWLGLERLTALLGSAPGGMSDMSLIALDMGAQGPTVVLMHLTRMVSVIVVVPIVVKLAVRWGSPLG
ncbi:AbrB family transcriptional regulator [Synechococcus sp. PCC 7336]|uniref:AbrB family transcriptional regulator n=1 Tax=Synechococcus sp. PCC 7336 TaxID=195250 RepID=UPI00034793FB|nr:AbrB family transcriptional regulator [Synechococcus sp. PCC 7336]